MNRILRANPALRLAAALLALVARTALAAAPVTLPPLGHATPAEWLNSPPLRAEELRGHPVLVEMWTFACSNCLASLPWMQRVSAAYRARGLTILGVHSPELREERDPANVAAAVRRLDIRYPVMLDGDFSFWRALDNHYWPAFYLFDRDGRLLATRFGELHTGEAGADSFEKLLEGQLPSGAAGAP